MQFISNLPRILFLCGFMGAGKSTVGKELANQLNTSFMDLDQKIEQEAGRSIPEIFAEEGEEKFRKQEKEALEDVIRDYEGVVSLGGGALQNQQWVDHLKSNGLLIFIETPFSVILERIQKNKDRPLLLDNKGRLKPEKELEKEMSALYEERVGYYRQAEITIHTDQYATLRETVEALIKKIRNHVSHY